ncbi:MAG: phosphoribosylformylglycinamidine synthase subunit PurL [Proteobacteria bacterium]|nr:phosphoribosylformylglycinamidine synthase subunit PurL [Pseudomonadota bacterium]
MPHRIEVGFKPGVRDALGEKIKRRIHEDLHIAGVSEVRTIEVYTLDFSLSPEDLTAVAAGPFSDPIIQDYSIDRPLASGFDWLVEVGFRPGVTDNVGRTAREAVELRISRTLRPEEKVYTSRQYLMRGNLDERVIREIATGLLANELIQTYRIFSWTSWDKEKGAGISIPRVKEDQEIRVEKVDLNVPDDELMQISRDRVLVLSLDEMKTIQRYVRDEKVKGERTKKGLGSRLTDCEIEALAQTWSEHCKHKIFNAIIEYREDGKKKLIKSLFNTFIRRSTEKIRRSLGRKDFCLSVFKDNAGVIRFNGDYNLVMKVETHNTPSALDPYGGALTGIVGVNRDPFGTGKGAKLIFNTDVFCFASPFYSKPLPPRILHPKRVYEGVREGVEHGGNKSGIPTVNGSIVFDDRFLGKPLVYCGTAGIMPRKMKGEPSEVKTALPGDLIVMTGGRIGKDGIHGATFSSEELHEGSPVTAVQIGDPIVQKKMTDFLLKARNLGLYRCITDNGAGGLSSSVGEMAEFSGGCELHLDKAPLKYHGLNPWEILLSEAQERMTLSVDPGRINEFLKLAEKMGVEATVLGRFTDSGKFHCLYDGKTVAYLDMKFLHDGVPRMRLKASWKQKKFEEPKFSEPGDLNSTLREMLSRLNICSKESVVRQYDHEVQGGSVVKPLVGKENNGPSDAGVIRPILGNTEGVVVSHGICPRYSDIDTYHMMACAIDEGIRNYIAVGGDPDHMAGLDNFCWCDPVQSEKTPDGEYKLAQLIRANQALYHYTVTFGIPCISGKDSMKNDYQIGTTKISIPPTVLFSVIGEIRDVRKAVTMDVKVPGDPVYVLGRTCDELGASEYYALKGFIGNACPKVNAKSAMKLYRALSSAMEKGLVQSCHDCSDGGLGVALAESSFAGGLGMEIDLRKVPSYKVYRNDYLLFSESQSRFVVTVSRAKSKKFESVMKGNVFSRVGVVRKDERILVTGLQGKIVIDADINELQEAWQKPLRF